MTKLQQLTQESLARDKNQEVVAKVDNKMIKGCFHGELNCVQMLSRLILWHVCLDNIRDGNQVPVCVRSSCRWHLKEK